MQLIDDVVVYSPSDLSVAADCEFALLRRLDERLGLVPAEPRDPDPMLERAARLGAEHEREVLSALVERHGTWEPGASGGVAVLPRAEPGLSGLADAHDRTVAAVRGGADVVYQADLFDGRLHGVADFLVRDATGRWQVQDTKLARHAGVTALLQVTAYAEVLRRAGVDTAPSVALRLGDRRIEEHPAADVAPVLADRRRRLQHLLDDHQRAARPVAWDEPGLRVCGRCADCEAEVERRRDLLLVARMRPANREHLRDAGIATIDQLAASDGPVTDVSPDVLAGLRTQARLQVRQSPPDGSEGAVVHQVVDEGPLRALPTPSPGDVFFDFEGDPLWSTPDGSGWGLEYLWGAVTVDGGEPDGRYTAWWAADRPGERAALTAFLRWLDERRRRWPDLHVYHYADYERSALLRLAAQHGTGEREVDDLLRAGVLVDLYATVRASVRVSQRSYSIKKLEPLYMGDDLRAGDVQTAADSLVAHPMLLEARARGDAEAAQELADSIADYNAYDCLSTWRLRDWLLGLVEPGPTAGGGVVASDAEPEASPAQPDPEPHVQVLATLAMHTGEPGDRSDDEAAVAALAASIGYRQREDKPFWWSWFDRLRRPSDELPRDRDVLVPETVEVTAPWALTTPKQRKPRRTLRLVGPLREGTGVRERASVKGLYEPVPPTERPVAGAVRGEGASATVVSVAALGDERFEVVVEETEGDPGPDALPVAIAVYDPPPSSKAIAAAAADVAAEALSSLPSLPPGPAFDLIRRVPPRLVGGGGLPDVGRGYVDAVEAAVRALDRSYLAVQGPPGSGKTYVGSHVVARLVASGWRVGVVAQSHAVVDHLLERVLEAGVDPSVVGKSAKGGDGSPRPWAQPSSGELAAFIDDHAATGCVVGGTTWTFSNAEQVPRGVLDLLVVEEAGQYALADTVAVSAATRRLLLLGDPQQLPQVTRGTHPVAVDTSALGWVAADHDTLPPHLGYFLARSWRMHPALCARVSRLSYEGRLESEPVATSRRRLDGVDPGVHAVLVEHVDRVVASPEEARTVTGLVGGLLGRTWQDGTTSRPLGQGDVLVVAPYNAQVRLLREHLAAAGLADVQVGTVDGFQGREAAVVVVSMTASSAAAAPRGLGFLLSRHRTNVAVSRAQWCAYVVRSPDLTDHLPATPAGLLRLGGFLRLTAD